MIRKFRRKIAIALLPTLFLSLKPMTAIANPALAAPAICATGAGCIFLGVVVLSGVTYYAWQSQDTGKKHYLKIEDPGNIPGQQETHFSLTAEGCLKMRQRFQTEARKLRLARIMPVKGGVLCIFEGDGAEAGYYDDRRY